MTQELSHAAQAVFDAAFPVYDDEILYVAPAKKHACMIAAAALRAAVAQTQRHPGHDLWQCDAEDLLAIADELEAQ
jgi:hypothetical protein